MQPKATATSVLRKADTDVVVFMRFAEATD